MQGYSHDSTAAASSTCHRHPNAYGPIYATDYNLNAENRAFSACSGAVADDIWNPGKGKKGFEPAQIDHPDIGPGTKLVTLTIGGNDAGSER